MNKRKIIIKNIIKNLWKGYIETIKEIEEILKARFKKIYEILVRLSHD